MTPVPFIRQVEHARELPGIFARPDEQTAVLEHRSTAAPLGAAQDFLAREHDVARVAAAKAEKRSLALGERLSSKCRVDSLLYQRLDDLLVNECVNRGRRFGQRVTRRDAA